MRRTSEHENPKSTAGTSSPLPDGCEEFIRAVYHHHATPLLRYATRLLNGDLHRAEDILQEATLRAWRHFAPTSAELDPASIRPWIFTVVRNLVVDHHRARSSRPSEAQPLEGLNIAVDDAIERILTTQIVLDALDELKPTHRDVIGQLYYRGRSVAEAAETLGVPQGTVKSRSYYALRSLRDILLARGILDS
ncbi:sigma-70 family RNA polymerase sigma factor [Streptomyces zaomyceticus]|uniref:sigma-70 family RNA polymerase sigma factor n=1 Tax=Streptomyces zaomyceticus TaxID=68286 RepID=UPI0036800F43